jgi:hypothetical protein
MMHDLPLLFYPATASGADQGMAKQRILRHAGPANVPHSCCIELVCATALLAMVLVCQPSMAQACSCPAPAVKHKFKDTHPRWAKFFKILDKTVNIAACVAQCKQGWHH